MATTKKIFVCSAGFGEGHNTAARCLVDALNDLGGSEFAAEFVDILGFCRPKRYEWMRRAYVTLMNRAPRLWSGIYRLFDRSQWMLDFNLAMLAPERKAFAQLLEQQKPVAVISTYPAYGYLLDEIARRGGPSGFLRVTVVTDSISINSIWHRCGSDFYSVPNEDTARALRDAGVPPTKIRVLGFPVDLRYAATGQLPVRPDPAGPDGRRVLYMINAGRKAAPEIVERLLALDGIRLTVTVGRDEEMRRIIERLIRASARPDHANLIGWTSEVPSLLAGNHLLISKAGGATTQETIAARCPMIISQIAPGQEEGNAQLLVDNGAGCLGLTPSAIATAVESAFADDARMCREWTANIGRLSRPDAARDNARFIFEQVAAREVG